MSELLDFYQQQANALTIPWLAKLQEQGRHDLACFKFPTRQDEDWKYTSVDELLQQRFIQNTRSSEPKCRISPGVPFSSSVIIQNGQEFIEEKWVNQQLAGLVIEPLSQAWERHADKIKPYLGQLLKSQNGFQALNMALLQSGVFVYLPAGICVETPIVLSYWQDKANQAVHTRHLIIAEEGSQATLVEDYSGAADCCYFTNTVTELAVARQAKIVHYKIQRESKLAYHIGHLAVVQDASSQFESHSFSFGGKLVRSDLSLMLQEEQARCFMNGIYLPREGQHVDHHTVVHHLVPNCQSEQDYKGVLDGRSRAIFNGRIIVAPGAQHTQAKQQNKNVLLSEQAEVDTKPQLEIFADDVLCSHGATVGQLDEDALFYLATRGIDPLEASRYLIHAFAADNLRLITHRVLAEWITTLLDSQLGWTL